MLATRPRSSRDRVRRATLAAATSKAAGRIRARRLAEANDAGFSVTRDELRDLIRLQRLLGWSLRARTSRSRRVRLLQWSVASTEIAKKRGWPAPTWGALAALPGRRRRQAMNSPSGERKTMRMRAKTVSRPQPRIYVPRHAASQPTLAQAVHGLLFPNWDPNWEWQIRRAQLADPHFGHPDLRRRVFWLANPGTENVLDWIDLMAHASARTIDHDERWRAAILGAVKHAKRVWPQIVEGVMEWLPTRFGTPGFTDEEVLRFDADRAARSGSSAPPT